MIYLYLKNTASARGKYVDNARRTHDGPWLDGEVARGATTRTTVYCTENPVRPLDYIYDIWSTLYILKTRLKVTSVFTALFGRSPTPANTRPARQLCTSSVLYGSGKVAANAGMRHSRRACCTMIDVQVKASASDRSW